MSNRSLHTSQPLVSVIIPAYNAETFIERTLCSVLSQTYQNLEVIIVDDGSKDRTAELVQAIAQQDSRIIFLQQTNAGVAAARNLGICHAQGEFIAPLDADDIWWPRNIEKQIQCISRLGLEVGLVYSWSIDIDENDKTLNKLRASRIMGEVYLTLLLHDFVANASSVLIRRSCLEKSGLYDSNLRKQKGQGGEDWDLYLRIAEHYHFGVVPEVLVGYRQVSNSMSTDYDQMAASRRLIWQSVQKKYPQIPVIIAHLSNISFYIHLAGKANQNSEYKASVDWLIIAMKESPSLALLRLDLFILLIKNLFRLLFTSQTSKNESEFFSEVQHQNCSVSIKNKTSHIDSRTWKTDTNLKFLIEQAIHYFVSSIFDFPRKGQSKSIEKLS